MADDNKIAAVDMTNLFTRELEGNYGNLVIKQAVSGDVGCVVWDAAIVLAKYLETDGFNVNYGLAKKRAVELGAGTGVVGLAAAAMGADVVGTDLEDFIPLIDLNKRTNGHLITGKFSARCLKWGSDVSSFLPHPDYVFIADCIYYEESLEPLVQTMNDLSGHQTSIFLCYEERRTGNKLELEKKFFKTPSI
ncbi:protein N-lysine methyltransferase METTL21D isoform X2 [Nematostella vectensis]|uniref:protein N-lysine methyltransferase METTL21D isoform X2 n=1 Tax=Nematostella vectensis TaxID=45351 RepID=UPI00207703AE|nr:protein N-lysine methyltransferase METTL21D isoform X2 [Nematostella vectensis]